MTTLEAAIACILPAALVYPHDAPAALGHVLGLLAARGGRPGGGDPGRDADGGIHRGPGARRNAYNVSTERL